MCAKEGNQEMFWVGFLSSLSFYLVEEDAEGLTMD